MADHSRNTLLDYIILGLLQDDAHSGYRLRKIIGDTAIGNYSNSPGTIYPALDRLVNAELIESIKGNDARGRVNRITEKGTKALDQWLRKPVTEEDVKKHMHILLLRFSLMSHTPVAEVVSFLKTIQVHVNRYIRELRAYVEYAPPALSKVGRLAALNGIAVFEAHKRWIVSTSSELKEQ